MHCCLFYSHLALLRGPKLFKRYITFLVSSPLVRRVKATYSVLKSLLLEAKKRHLKANQRPQFLYRIIVQG